MKRKKEVVSPTVAFAQGEVLPKNERRRLLRKHFKPQANMSLRRACAIAIKYGLGLIDEVDGGLIKLTRAWLRIGERVWQRIVAEAQVLDWISISYSKLSKMLRALCCRQTPAWTW